MIGTHDSMTYLSPRWWIFRPFAWLWRTQTKTLREQIALGVKYIDIRVKPKNGIWVFYHGIVELQGNVWFLSEIADLCKTHNLKARLLLESGNESAQKLFIDECNKTILHNPYISFIGIKKGWKILKNQDPPIKDCTYVPFLSNKSLWWNIRHMKWSTIALWAKKHNPIVTDELIVSDTVYFMDRI